MMLRRAGRVAAAAVGLVLACVVVALVATVAHENIRDRDRLFDTLRDRNRAAMDSSRRATRRIDLLSNKIDQQSGLIQALQQQVVSLGATPVTVTTAPTTAPTTTTVRRTAGAATTAPPRPAETSRGNPHARRRRPPASPRGGHP